MSQTSGSLGRRVGRGLGWSTASNIILRMGNLLVSIIMARLIAPEQFGVFAVAFTVWTVLSSLAEFGLGADLVRSTDLERRIPTVSTLGVVISSMLAGGMMLSANPLAAAFDSQDSAGVIRLMSLSLVVIGFSIVPAAVLQREIRQGALFVISAGSMVTSTATMAMLALSGLGPAALAWGQIAAQLVTVCAQYVVTRRRPRFGFDLSIAKESAAFCLPLAFANVLSWLLLSVDNLIVARTLGPAELGVYVLAFNVSSWPMSAVGTSIRVVALPVFAHLGSDSKRNRALVDVSGLTWTVSVLMGVLLATLAAPIIGLLYGERWLAAVGALTGLAAFGAFRVIFDLSATFLIAAGRSKMVLIVQIWWILVLVPAMYFGVARFGLAGAGWAHVAVGVAAVLPAYLWCLRKVGVDWIAFIRAWVRPSVCVIPAALACWWLGQAISTPLLALLAGTVAAAVLYVLPMGRWALSRIKKLKQYEADTSSLTAAAANG